VYFTPEWASLLRASFHNFLQSLLAVVPLPAVLAFNTDRRLRLALQQQVGVGRGLGVGVGVCNKIWRSVLQAYCLLKASAWCCLAHCLWF
jgi:hypothetical protein